MQGEAASSFEKDDGENVPTAHREGAGLTSTSEHPLYLGDGTPIPIGLTKSGFKKQRRREAWESGKDERKSAAREKKREKAQARRQHNRELPEDEKLARRQRMAADIKRRKTQRKPFPANIVLDSGFDELMTEKEIASIGSQLSFTYSSNRNSLAPFENLVVAGPSRLPAVSSYDLNGDAAEASLRKNFQPHESVVREGYWQARQQAQARGECVAFSHSRTGKALDTAEGAYKRWKGVNFVEYGGLEALWDTSIAKPSEAKDNCNVSSPTAAQESLNTPQITAETSDDVTQGPAKNSQWSKRVPLPEIKKEDVVYLTADSNETIDRLEEGKTYVIGAVVDRNRYKNLCLRKAQSLGIRHARLPIDASNLEGKSLASRKVLTINQVLDILLGWTEQHNEIARKKARAAATQGDGGDDDVDEAENQDAKEPNWTEAIARGLPGRKFSNISRKQKRTRTREGWREDQGGDDGGEDNEDGDNGDGDDDDGDDGDDDDGGDGGDGGNFDLQSHATQGEANRRDAEESKQYESGS
ncbi:unnamed protein product [Jaminaea pallidilutea]